MSMSGGQPPTGDDAGTWQLSGARRQWLDRWIALDWITPSQAVAIERFEQDHVDGVTQSDIAGWSQRWVAAQLITAPQGSFIQRDVAATIAPAPAPASSAPADGSQPAPTGAPSFATTPTAPQSSAPRPASAPAKPGVQLSILVELLGYLGGALAIGGAMYLMRGLWPDVPGYLRLLLTAAASAAFLVLGALVKVHEEPAFFRLRIVTWLASVAVTGALGAVFADTILQTTYPPTWVGCIAAAVTLESAVLWAGRQRPWFQGVAMIGLLTAVGGFVFTAAGAETTGIALWGVALVLLVLGFANLTTTPTLTVVIGAAGVAVASLFEMPDHLGLGLLIGTCTIAVLVIVGPLRVLPERVVGAEAAAIVGVTFSTLYFPWTAWYFSTDAAIATATAFVLLGLVIVALALLNLYDQSDLMESYGILVMYGGTCFYARQDVGLAPLIGLVLAIAFVALGTAQRRAPFIVFGWIGVALFGIWEVRWLWDRIQVSAILVVLIGMAIVAVAVFLSRRVSRMRARAEAGDEARDEAQV